MENLIAEYQSKMNDQDKVIEFNTEKIRSFRNKDLTTLEYNNETQPFVMARNIAQAKRQCYLQFTKELENL